MTTIQQIEKQYDKLTTRERFALHVAAAARDDKATIQLLVNSAPKVLLEFPSHKGLEEGFRDLTLYHVMQQLGTAGAFFMILQLSNEDTQRVITTIEGQEIPTGETALELCARRFLEGLEAYKAICQEYGIDPEVLRDDYNDFPMLTLMMEMIARKAFEMSDTELTDLEETKVHYGALIEKERRGWAEDKAK